MAVVETEDLSFDYIKRDDKGDVEGIVRAVSDVNITIEPGEFIAILGHNGSGKSTLARHLNALLMPTEGTVYICGDDTADEKKLWDIRQNAGMVFQNPDNQIVGTIVEEDVGFGPENLGMPTEDIWKAVDEALSSVGMTAYRMFRPDKLSGGQKQRVAIAGVLAMKPKCIIMDEPTAMLDPNGRREVINTVTRLNREEKITVVLITHFMDEAVKADRIYVMDKGSVVMEGTPKEIFSRVDELKEIRLDVPQATEMAYELGKMGYNMPSGILNTEELVEAICQLF